jgi:hypothetical protein
MMTIRMCSLLLVDGIEDPHGIGAAARWGQRSTTKRRREAKAPGCYGGGQSSIRDIDAGRSHDAEQLAEPGDRSG